MCCRPLDEATQLSARLDALEAEQQAALFPPTFPLAALCAEAKRELDMRRRVYPDWVRRGTLSSRLAAHRLALQQAICAVLHEAMAVGDNANERTNACLNPQ